MSPTDSGAEVRVAKLRLCALAALSTMATTALAVLYPHGVPLSESSHRSVALVVGWILTQSFALVLPGLLLGLFVTKHSRRLGRWLGSVAIFAIPLLVLLDNFTVAWISERFLSRGVAVVVCQLPNGLAQHVANSTLHFVGGLLIGYVLFVMIAFWLSGRIANAMKRAKPVRAVLGMSGLALLFAIPSLWNWRTTVAEVSAGSARHPFCAMRLMSSPGVGDYATIVAPGLSHDTESSPGDTESSSGDTELFSGDNGPNRSAGGMATVLQQLVQRQSDVSMSAKPDRPPDVLVVVIESFRHELVANDIMPSLFQFAQTGIHCREHFSGGNATNHGIFSLLNGLDATWYSRGSRRLPILNRVFRQSGYEVGFFAGHNDWAAFNMDGFVSAKHFDRFQILRPNGLESDRTSTARAASFLDEGRSKRPPRLAILYLYGTHATYPSYADDRIFQPAADDGFIIPYSKQDAPLVWNRYKNSARSVDRLLAAVLKDDRIVVVTGDHGEAFLEDGVCGHGTRISRYQNMTPLIIAGPGISPRVIDQPTMHADVLPTLLGLSNIRVNDPDVFDGLDLTVPANSLSDRIVLTRNYLTKDCGLIQSGMDGFAHRVSLSLEEWTAIALNEIDASGNKTRENRGSGNRLLKAWMQDRFDL